MIKSRLVKKIFKKSNKERIGLLIKLEQKLILIFIGLTNDKLYTKIIVTVCSGLAFGGRRYERSRQGENQRQDDSCYDSEPKFEW
ncbi:MAG: hypothetical protein ACE364_04160 [Chlorobiota bacterium]